MLWGATGNDVLFGGVGNDVANGDAGNDTVCGGLGDDTLSGFTGNDTVFGEDGNDYVGGGDGRDSLYGGIGNDLIVGDGNALVLTHFASSAGGVPTKLKIVNAADGPVDLYRIDQAGASVFVRTIAAGEAVVITTDTGTNFALRDPVANYYVSTIRAAADQTVIFGAETQDSIVAGDGNVTVHGQFGADSIDGGAGDDILYGGSGDDRIAGGAGSDTIYGGAGNDTLTGGIGNDTFAVDDAGGVDTVTDFDLGDDNGDTFFNDQLDVSALRTAGGAPVTAWDVTVVDDGFGNAKLIFPEGETIVLQGVDPRSMSSVGQLFRAGIPCFTPSTQILSAFGERPVEALRPGDLVQTRDNGLQPIAWVGMRRLDRFELAAQLNLRPIRIAARAFGNALPLIVSPQHGVLLTAGDGQETQLVRAKHLALMQGGQARVMQGVRCVTYVHLMFEAHQIIFSNGIPTESFYPGPQALAMMQPPS